MEFKGTKGKWVTEKTEIVRYASKGSISPYWKQICSFVNNGTDECKANALLISKAPEMLDMLDELCENLAFQLDRLGVCGQGDGKGRKADTDSYGGTELLERAKQLIKEVTEIK